jgi:peptide/nickel transport system substrate-binding protein
LLCTVAASACAQSPASRPDGPNTLRVGMAEGSDAARSFATLLVHEGLTRVSLDGRAQPGLAESWQWEAGRRRLRVSLRENVLFHDGTPLTADIAAEALRQAIRREGPLYPSLTDITAIRSEDALHLLIDVSRPSSLLPEDLSILLRMKNPDIGTGPYRVVSTSVEEVVMASNREYYLGRPGIDRIVFKPYDSPRTTWSTFLRGELDMVSDVPQNTVEFIRNNDVQIVSFPRWYQNVIAFNSRRAPFNSPVVRRALNFAIDRGEIVDKHLQGAGVPATSPIWPKYWAYEAGVATYTYDPARATALFDSVHLTPGTAKAVPGRPTKMRLRFTCLIPQTFAVWEEVALELQRQLFDVGVDIDFVSLPLDEYTQRMIRGDFDAVFTDLISGPALSRPYIFWASAAALKGYNVFGYENPRVEGLFAELRQATNDAATRSATRRLQQEWQDDPPALFLAWSQRARAIRKDFHVILEPERDPFLTLWRWTPAYGVLKASAQ